MNDGSWTETIPEMVTAKKTRRRIKRSGIIYFAANDRIPNMVKIGMTTDSAESRLQSANRKHEFMCGRWSINQKVKTNNAVRTEELSHRIFSEYHDKESVSGEMYFIPEGMTVKQMADTVREKDKILLEQLAKKKRAKEAVRKAEKELEKINAETSELISLKNDFNDSTDDQ